jgi:hypothetical protein
MTPAGIPCVSIHRDGSFTFHDGRAWVRNAASVPADVLAALPADERARVERAVWRRMGGAA